MKSLIKNILKVYSKIKLLKSKLVTVSIFSIASIFLELLGLGVFIPVIDFLTNDNLNKSYSIFKYKIEFISKTEILLIFLSLIFIIFSIKAIVNVYLSYLQSKLSSEIDEIISSKVYSMILSKSYEDYTKQTNASYTSIIINEVEQFSELVKHIITIVVNIYSFRDFFFPDNCTTIFNSFNYYLHISLFYIDKIFFKKRLINGEKTDKFIKI